MHLTELVHVFENVLSAEECNSIIALVEERNHLLRLHDTPLYTFYQMDLIQTDLLPLSRHFADTVARYAEQYFRFFDLDRFVGVQGFEAVRVKKYSKNSGFEFGEHIDVIDKASSVRYLTFILYLNDNDGNTTFDTLGLSFNPKQGSMLVFPPMWMFPHAGKAPTDHDKYIMMTSLHYT